MQSVAAPDAGDLDPTGRPSQTIDFLVMHEAQEWVRNATGFRR